MTYQLATKYDVIAGWLTRNKFQICKKNYYNLKVKI